jgi:transcriptional regulator with XRE-family HTH domain
MSPVSALRLARLQHGLTLDDLFLRSRGRLRPARISRIERGICAASNEEASLLAGILGIAAHAVQQTDLNNHLQENSKV